MIIDGNKIIAEEGLVLRRILDQMIAGREYYLGYIWELNGQTLDPPHLEVPEDFTEVPEDWEKYDREQKYPLLVEQYIREKYSVSDELAIHRQKEHKIVEFNNYYLFCEDCKRRAKIELGL